MAWVLPLPLVVPLLAAALIAGGDHFLPSPLQDAIGIAAAGTATAFALVAMVASQSAETLHWFGGWQPREGVVVGVAFTADPLGAGMAALCCGLGMLALIFSVTYLKEPARLYNSMILVFCGAMAAFSLSGDLFNIFVWFELMGVAAYALAGYKVE